MQFVYGLIFVLSLIGFIYFSQSFAVALMFAFLDGPSESVFYMDFNSGNDTTIFGLFVSTIIIGIIGVILGLLFSCYRRPSVRDNDNGGQSDFDDDAGGQQRIMIMRVRPHDMNPFSDRTKGYRIIDFSDADEEDIANPPNVPL